MTELMQIDAAGLATHFARQPMSVAHTLQSHPLLEIDAVAALAERLPADRVEHNYAVDLSTVVDPDAVSRSEQPIGEIARGIADNGCWMVLKNIESDPAYKALLDATLDEVAPLVADQEGPMTLREGFIFLSAPNSITPSHTDPEHNFLLQVRGIKDMVLGSFPDAATEQRVLEETATGGHRNITWEPVDQTPFALEPGDGVYVPPHRPHLVRNGPGPSVSLSITFRTARTEDVQRIHALNAQLRRIGRTPSAPGANPALDRRKAAGAKALGRLRRAVGK